MGDSIIKLMQTVRYRNFYYLSTGLPAFSVLISETPYDQRCIGYVEKIENNKYSACRIPKKGHSRKEYGNYLGQKEDTKSNKEDSKTIFKSRHQAAMALIREWAEKNKEIINL